MRHFLLTSTCIVALAAPMAAETTISNTVTGPVRTSTVKAGRADDILINSTGVVNGTAGWRRHHRQQSQAQQSGLRSRSANVSNVAGVDVAAGVTSDITLSGKIMVDESYTPPTPTMTAISTVRSRPDRNRFGIRTNGAMTGNILIGSHRHASRSRATTAPESLLGGPLTGNFRHDGKIDVLGNNSVGVQLSDVSGNVRLAGPSAARGQNAIAVRSTGDVGGAMVLQGAIVSTGYRFTTPPSRSEQARRRRPAPGRSRGLDRRQRRARASSSPFRPRIRARRTPTRTTTVSRTARKARPRSLSYGSAAALRIGSAGAIAIGATEGTGTGFGLIVDGGILGDGVYTGVDGNALQIGGLGGTVSHRQRHRRERPGSRQVA